MLRNVNRWAKAKQRTVWENPTRLIVAHMAILSLCIFAEMQPVYAAYTYSKIADTSTLVPGTSLTFSDFSRVDYDGQNIAFIGTRSANDFKGVYQWNGTDLQAIASVGDLVPSTAVSIFSDFANVSLDNGVVAFQAAGGGVEGVYTNLGGSLRRVADTSMVMPDTTALFDSMVGIGTPSFDVAIDGNDIYFSAFGTNGSVFDEGVYKESNGVLSTVANRSTIFPGETSPFTFFRGEIDAQGGDVVFEPSGLFTTHGAAAGSFRKVFDRDSSLPGLTSPVSIPAPNTFSIDNGYTAFTSVSSDDFFDDHLFIQDPSGVNRVVASISDTNPFTNNEFRVLSNYYSLNNNRLLFSGWSSFNNESVHGIYLSNENGFDPIISDLETLDGKNLTSLGVFKDSLVGEDFVFEAAFDDGSTGLFLATAEQEPPSSVVEITPTFDVQLRPGDEYPIGDGQTTLVIDGGFGTNFPELQVLLEFPLADLPAGAEVVAAELRLDATTNGSLTINAQGYPADGLASLSDEQADITLIGSAAGSISIAGDVTIALDAAFIESLLANPDHLGIRLESSVSGPFVNIASLESLTGFAPTLLLTLAIDESGDFDQDGDVDGADFLAWQRGESTTPLDADDLDTWLTNYGDSALAVASAVAVPEPTGCALVLTAMLVSRLQPRRNTTCII